MPNLLRFLQSHCYERHRVVLCNFATHSRSFSTSHAPQSLSLLLFSSPYPPPPRSPCRPHVCSPSPSKSSSASLDLSRSPPPSSSPMASRLIAATNLSRFCSFLTFLDCLLPFHTLVSLHLLHPPPNLRPPSLPSSVWFRRYTLWTVWISTTMRGRTRWTVLSPSLSSLSPSPAAMLNLSLFIIRLSQLVNQTHPSVLATENWMFTVQSFHRFSSVFFPSFKGFC